MANEIEQRQISQRKSAEEIVREEERRFKESRDFKGVI